MQETALAICNSKARCDQDLTLEYDKTARKSLLRFNIFYYETMGISCLCDLAMLCTLWFNSFFKNFSTSRSFLSSTLGSIRRYQSERRRRNHHPGKFIKRMNCGECNVVYFGRTEDFLDFFSKFLRPRRLILRVPFRLSSPIMVK
ncbi:uncharacterized protein [Oscarella lobularis]|uniref:uncharacterized protein isoform X3 n=1 Tax=Oscarella lobularis TaxID=121494 RepID=UPI0033139078